MCVVIAIDCFFVLWMNDCNLLDDCNLLVEQRASHCQCISMRIRLSWETKWMPCIDFVLRISPNTQSNRRRAVSSVFLCSFLSVDSVLGTIVWNKAKRIVVPSISFQSCKLVGVACPDAKMNICIAWHSLTVVAKKSRKSKERLIFASPVFYRVFCLPPVIEISYCTEITVRSTVAILSGDPRKKPSCNECESDTKTLSCISFLGKHQCESGVRSVKLLVESFPTNKRYHL